MERVIDGQLVNKYYNAKMDKETSRQCSFLEAWAVASCLELHQSTGTEQICAIYQNTLWSSSSYTTPVSWISFGNNIIEWKAFIACAFGLTALPYRHFQSVPSSRFSVYIHTVSTRMQGASTTEPKRRPKGEYSKD